MTDDRGLAALAERLRLALGWPTRAYPEYRLPDGLRTGDGDNDAWAELAGTVLGPSGRFSPDGGLDAQSEALLAAIAEQNVYSAEDFRWFTQALAESGVSLATPKEEQG